MAVQLNTSPAMMTAGALHRTLLNVFRAAARPFAGTPLGSAIARRIPFAPAAYYFVYSRVARAYLDVETSSGTLVVDLADRSVAQKLYLGRAYEPKECEVLTRLIEPGMTFFDVGAHVGYYTLLASRLVGDSGQVVAFEPDPHNYELLVENIRRNGLSNVEPVNAAVGAREEQLSLYRDPNYAGDHRIHATEGRESVSVRCTTVDAFCVSGRGPDVMKMDVQGAEGEVLKGMRDVIMHAPPLAIMAEYWPAELAAVGSDPADFVESIRAAGYLVYEVLDDADPHRIGDVGALIASLPGEQDYTNLLFIREDCCPGWLAG